MATEAGPPETGAAVAAFTSGGGTSQASRRAVFEIAASASRSTATSHGERSGISTSRAAGGSHSLPTARANHSGILAGRSGPAATDGPAPTRA